MMNVKDITLQVNDITLSGKFYLPGDGSGYPVVCLCHGIPSGIVEADDGGYPALAERICEEGFAVLIFNFRGSRNSEGNFDIFGWTQDLAAAIDYLRLVPEVDRGRIALVGFSAGAAVAICVAAQDKTVAAVASCACPADFDSLIANTTQSIEYFRNIGIIRDKDFPESEEEWRDNFKVVNPLYYVAGISPRPLLLVHGDKDDVVPVDNVQKLYDKAQEPKKLVIIEGTGHRLRRDEKAVRTVIHWLKETLILKQ